MSAREEAATFDAADRPVEAARAYEMAITEAGADLDTFLNLAVLYFQCTDHGYLSHHRLSNDFIAHSWERANQLLLEAAARFGAHPEIEFWRKYFAFVVLGAEPFFEECEALVRSGISLVPYFYLFTSPNGERHRQQAQRLFESVAAGRTAKERYIRGILEKRLRSVRDDPEQ